MKKQALIIVSTISLLLSSCDKNVLYVNSHGRSGSPSYAICEAIEYPFDKRSLIGNFSYVVNIMVANLYYGKRYDGTYGSLFGEGNNVGYKFESISIFLSDFDKQIIKRYEVDINEYSKQENGIDCDKKAIHKNDFNLIYSFDLIELFPSDYNHKITFSVLYKEIVQNGYQLFGSDFIFNLEKNSESIYIQKYSFS